MTRYLQEHITNMLRYTKEVVWCVDANTYDLLYTNDSCYELWGFTATEMMADKNIFFSHLYPDDVEICMNGFINAKQYGRSHNEFRIIHKSGSIKIIKGDAIFIKGNDDFPDTFTGITLDVTEERGLQEKIAASEKRFHIIANDSPVMIWASDAQNGLTYVNHAWTTFTGKDIASLSGTSWMQLLHPDDVEGIKQKRGTIYSSLTTFEIECRFLNKAGEYRNVVMKGTPQFNTDGNFTGFIGTGFDITEIKSLNEKLADSELKFKSIANDSPILMWTADATKKCTFFNAAWARFSGLEENDLLGDKWTALLHPEDKPLLSEKRDAHFISQTPFNIECRLKNKHDEYRWIAITGTPQFNSKNEFIGFVGNGIDITALKNYSLRIQAKNTELYEALQESKRLLHIVNKTKNIIVLTDTEGKITWANNAFTKKTGYTLEEAPTKVQVLRLLFTLLQSIQVTAYHGVHLVQNCPVGIFESLYDHANPSQSDLTFSLLQFSLHLQQKLDL